MAWSNAHALDKSDGGRLDRGFGGIWRDFDRPAGFCLSMKTLVRLLGLAAATLLACGDAPPDEARNGSTDELGAAGTAPTGRPFACFPETGQCVTGAFLRELERHGLASIGYPIGPRRLEALEDGSLAEVQWFERARFEDHGGRVLLARLGAHALERDRGVAVAEGRDEGAKEGCRFFPPTRHYVCGELLSALDRLGVERVGLPLEEATDGGTKQWFERVRLEIQPGVTDPTSPWRVLGGHIGRTEMRATSDFVHRPARPFEGLVGWAYSPRPELTRAQIGADMAKMAAAGANVVYVSHANPGEVSPDTEPGLTFSVWDALRAGVEPEATRARTQIARVADCVAAAGAAKLRVVLAVGYQIEMGAAWSDRHPESIRRDADGSPMLTWTELRTGRTASPYATAFQDDIEAYWRWVDATFVRPNPHVVALNLGDEPMGADWSAPAKAAFERRYGVTFDAAPAEARGHFLGGVLADLASWSAGAWLRIDRDVHVLHTWHVQRDVPWFPDFERIFAASPASYVFSADTHLHDAPPELPPLDPSLMLAQARTLGWLSRVYDRPLMLWTSANDWGLGCQRSARRCHFGVDDATAQVGQVLAAARDVGGNVGMLMAFAFNMRWLGAFGPAPDPAVYDPDVLFRSVSGALASARPTMTRRGTETPDPLVVDRGALERHVAERLPALQRERRGGAHVVEPFTDLGARRDLLRSTGVTLLSGRAADEAVARGGRALVLPGPQ